MSQKEIDRIFQRAWRIEDVRSDVESSFDQYVALDMDNFTATHMRTIFVMGAPLDIDGYRYQNKTDNETEQDVYRKEFVLKIQDIVNDAAGNDPEAFGAIVRFNSLILSFDLFFGLIIADLMFAVVSVVFVFFYFIIHMKSKFLSAIGTSIILFSFPLTVCFTEGIG